MTDAAARTSIWNRDYFLLWQGAAVSALGGQAYSIALLLWAKETTQSGTAVGAIMFAGGITSLAMPFGGVLADRYSRVRLLVVLDCLSGLFVLGLALLFCWLPGTHPALIPLVLALNFARGICMALFHPVTTALLPDLVPGESLTRANSNLQTTVRLTVLIGQSLGGLLFRLLGAPLLLVIDGASFLISAVTELWIREPVRVQSPGHVKQGLLLDLAEGLRFTARIRGFRIYLLEAACANFFIAALFVGLPFYVEDVLRVSVDWYGYLLGAMGFGAVVGSTLARRFPTPGVRRGTIQLVCLVGLSGCLLPLSLVRTPWAAWALIAGAWACVGFHGVLLTTLVQKRTPPSVRGRVFGLLTMIRHGLTPLGMAVFGLLIDVWDGHTADVLFWTGTAGLVTILCALLCADYRWFFTGDEQEVVWP